MKIRNMKLAEINSWYSKVYGENAMSGGMVRKWVRHFNIGCKNMND